MTLKWDLFVPFVAQSVTVLKDGGSMCLITSSAIAKAPYADALRRQLLAATQPREIHFFPNMRLFADAVVENTIVLAEKGVAPSTHGVARYWHTQVPTTGSRVECQTLPLSYGDDVFRQILPTLKLKKGVKQARLVDLCYLRSGRDRLRRGFGMADRTVAAKQPVRSSGSGKNRTADSRHAPGRRTGVAHPARGESEHHRLAGADRRD
jgi:hypothetical protein